MKYIFAKSDYESIKIDLHEIQSIQGAKDYLKIYIAGPHKTIPTRMGFKEMLAKLSSNQFLKGHKLFMVNAMSIKTMQRNSIVINAVQESSTLIFIEELTALNYTISTQKIQLNQHNTISIHTAEKQ